MNHYGEISGDDLNSTNVHQPVRIIESSVIDMAIGRNHSLFIKSDNTLWGMGLNAHGQLGKVMSQVVLLPYKLIQMSQK